MKLNEVVWHVAHPEIHGHIDGPVDSSGYIDVVFERPVAFPPGSSYRIARYWRCNTDLLFYSPKDAIRRHKPQDQL